MNAYQQFQELTTRTGQTLMLGHDKRFRELADEINGRVFCDKSRDDLWFFYEANYTEDLIDICFGGKDFSTIVSSFKNTFVSSLDQRATDFAFEIASGVHQHYDGHNKTLVAQLYVATMIIDEEIIGEFYYVD